MRLSRIDLRIVHLPLVRPFATSSSVKDWIQHVLVQVVGDRGIEGWGECASPTDPYYCAETTETCWHILRDFLAPAVIGREWETIDELIDLFGPIKGNHFARAGLEMACWDVLAKAQSHSLASMLGGTRSEILSGVSLGIERDMGRLFALIEQYLVEGYRRIKLKIKPGHDVEVVRLVRERFGDIPLQVDANSSYTLDDIESLKRLDAYGLLLIEQPLAHDDIIDHARLQAVLATPVCLDESIHSADDARKALEIGACRVINIKVSRVGGLREAKRIHDLCLARNIPVWCGGMHEFGIGRAANVALASLPGFTLPGDVSGSDKYYAEDIVDPPIRAVRGTVPVPSGKAFRHWSEAGLGHVPDLGRIRRGSLRTAHTHARSDGQDTYWDSTDRTPDSHDALRKVKDFFVTLFDGKRDFYLSMLREMVERETPSRDKAACDAFARWLVDEKSWPWHHSEVVPNASGGDHVLMRCRRGYDSHGLRMDQARKPALILAHYDTVWPLGTSESRPFTHDEKSARGPGVYDMKASLLIVWLALARNPDPFRNVNVLITSDEEIGSPTSRALIEEMAREAEYVLVLEPPLPDGSLKTSRKGVGGYTIEARGRSAHAGIEPERGANAVVELAYQVMGLQLLNNPKLGTTLNVGTIEGGTTANVVPDRASCRIDVRASTPVEAARIDGALMGLTPITPGTTLHVSGGFNRPPMERSPGIASLFEKAREIGRTLGMELTEGSTGGGSDANFTAALGVPTLDGLGALGGGAHAEDEHVIIDSIPERAALLAALLMNL